MFLRENLSQLTFLSIIGRHVGTILHSWNTYSYNFYGQCFRVNRTKFDKSKDYGTELWNTECQYKMICLGYKLDIVIHVGTEPVMEAERAPEEDKQ